MTEKSILLGEQDYELLRLLSHGAGNREIAEALCKSAFTVRNQLSAMFKKMSVSNRTQAVANYKEPNEAAFSKGQPFGTSVPLRGPKQAGKIW